ncbi:MAG TPA: rod shape-determining protein MreC [Alphaproteobacteria bacterium]|nr:rod shape-determining protein MreC [Alphaproteobacteria bacterium]
MALKAVAQRFSFLLLVVTAVALMTLGKVDTALVDGVRVRVTDAVAPILDAMSRPAATVADVISEVQALAELRTENAQLRSENEALRQYREAAYRLEAENLSLRMLLNYKPTVAHSFVTARVIGDNSGAFVRSLMINLGTANGIRDGQAVLGGHGLIGRVVQTGERSARILLITDLNARIPVKVQSSRNRAILGGDNTEQPRLLYLTRDSDVKVGERVVTSGHGGMFPPGLPVGIVASVGEHAIRVQPLEDFSRLEYVRIVDFHDPETDIGLQVAPGYAR